MLLCISRDTFCLVDRRFLPVTAVASVTVAGLSSAQELKTVCWSIQLAQLWLGTGGAQGCGHLQPCSGLPASQQLCSNACGMCVKGSGHTESRAKKRGEESIKVVGSAGGKKPT